MMRSVRYLRYVEWRRGLAADYRPTMADYYAMGLDL